MISLRRYLKFGFFLSRALIRPSPKLSKPYLLLPFSRRFASNIFSEDEQKSMEHARTFLKEEEDLITIP